MRSDCSHRRRLQLGIWVGLLVLILSLRDDIRPAHAENLEMISWYWHFVDGVWIVVFTVVYIIGR